MLSLIDPDTLPQDPYLPQVNATGPSFLDTGACLCAIQTTPESDKDDAVWQCIGNQTQGVYASVGTNTGKWFNPQNGGTNVNGSIDDASNAPDATKTYVWDNSTSQLVETSDFAKLSVYDQACTAENQTTFSTAYYQATAEKASGSRPISAAPCWGREGALPVLIQKVDEWQSKGCNEGFLCRCSLLSAPLF